VDSVTSNSSSQYPTAPKGEDTDVLHGITVPDPFRALEDPDAGETVAWEEEQRTLFNEHRDRWTARDGFRERLTALLRSGTVGAPVWRGTRSFHTRRTPDQEHAVLLTTDPGGDERVLIDPLGRRIAANPPFDGGRHGTHVCGTIAGGKTSQGVSIGVAPEANLFVAGVLIGDATLLTLMEGISWAVEKGVDIISMSLGFSYYEPNFREVFKILIEQFGILPIVAIGNENHGNSSSPGNSPTAFSVGAIEKMRGGKVDVAFFSSGASLVFPGDEPHALEPDRRRNLLITPDCRVRLPLLPEERAAVRRRGVNTIQHSFHF
jgi:subtilisin family serine protease